VPTHCILSETHQAGGAHTYFQEDNVVISFVKYPKAFRREGVQDTLQGTPATPDGTCAPLAAPLAPTILIAEDESSIRHALEQLLTRAGYQVEVVANGQEALTACHHRAYTQILCDLWMPLVDGQGFYQALQRCQPHLCARVVFLTGDTLTPDVQAFLEHARVPVLIKPFTAERLRALLRARCPQERG
jgi:CheY-like chemotaxis protein